ncbi:MAG: uracil-DNA glycosylase [Chloroflexi bacterium]|nr:MAG: uracil-DNA glycosylase [Chloroflexota bacterium]
MQQLPMYPTLESARLAAQECRACARSETRSQVVFGAGATRARLMLVGESPSGTDDATGKPFTGPAGRLLDHLLGELGIHRRDLWITNLTRCFAGVERNGRIENRPARSAEIRACAPWLELELRYVNPKVIVAIGAPAAKYFLGASFQLTAQRGSAFEVVGGRVVIPTVQPAYVMRLQSIDPSRYDLARAELLEDLRTAAIAAGMLPPRPPLPE